MKETMKIQINPAWSEPNGSLKSFAYKMVCNADFRTDIWCIWSFFALWGGVCVWVAHGIS